MPGKSAFLHLTKLWLRGGRSVVVLVCLSALGWAYAIAFWQQFPSPAELRSPHEMEQRHLALTAEAHQDQQLDFTLGVSEPLNNWLPHRTDGLVRPLWPWLAAWMMDDTDTAGTAPGYSARFAKRVQVAKLTFTLTLLMFLGLALARAFSVPAALLAVILTGFGVLLPSGKDFMPDMPFAILFLLTWVCCIAALKRNSLWLYGMIGFLAALTNLTAPTATPLLLVFVRVSTLRWLWGWILEHLPREEGGTSLWVWRNHWLGMLLLVACHFITVGPMLAHAYRTHGEAMPFHWRWFDSADELRTWTVTHQTLEAKQAVPVDQQPNYANYMASHAPELVKTRLQHGAQSMFQSVLIQPWDAQPFPCPRGVFVAALAAVLSMLLLMLCFVLPRAHHAGQALHPETAPVVLFSVLSLLVCTLDFGWDTPVLTQSQRPLALYAPLVLCLLWACEALVRRARRRSARLPVLMLYEIVLWALCGLATWRMIAVLQPGSFTA